MREDGGADRIAKKKYPRPTNVMDFVTDLYFRKASFNVNLYIDFIPMNEI